MDAVSFFSTFSVFDCRLSACLRPWIHELIVARLYHVSSGNSLCICATISRLSRGVGFGSAWYQSAATPSATVRGASKRAAGLARTFYHCESSRRQPVALLLRRRRVHGRTGGDAGARRGARAGACVRRGLGVLGGVHVEVVLVEGSVAGLRRRRVGVVHGGEKERGGRTNATAFVAPGTRLVWVSAWAQIRPHKATGVRRRAIDARRCSSWCLAASSDPHVRCSHRLPITVCKSSALRKTSLHDPFSRPVFHAPQLTTSHGVHNVSSAVLAVQHHRRTRQTTSIYHRATGQTAQQLRKPTRDVRVAPIEARRERKGERADASGGWGAKPRWYNQNQSETEK